MLNVRQTGDQLKCNNCGQIDNCITLRAIFNLDTSTTFTPGMGISMSSNGTVTPFMLNTISRPNPATVLLQQQAFHWCSEEGYLLEKGFITKLNVGPLGKMYRNFFGPMFVFFMSLPIFITAFYFWLAEGSFAPVMFIIGAVTLLMGVGAWYLGAKLVADKKAAFSKLTDSDYEILNARLNGVYCRRCAIFSEVF